MRFIVDTMNDLGLELMSAVSYVENIDRSFSHKLELELEFRYEYNEAILQAMPDGWNWYKFSVKDGKVWLSGLRYIEEYVWTGAETVTDRLNHIIKEFENYLGTRDTQATKSILMLMGS
ncbi:hypothetical protein HBE96_08540 [Clostridium sp. P21]|uniref:Uncharacterized protein n=1 Tax=Clostridium muellerianum TaxID=2716538 RepID=A0A7Y0EGL2_9CLOT|nr:hypothetical protein [Clostridium muellerianum]NMM62742.1 hypothetical protein [Clostridium muellerianum]